MGGFNANSIEITEGVSDRPVIPSPLRWQVVAATPAPIGRDTPEDRDARHVDATRKLYELLFGATGADEFYASVAVVMHDHTMDSLTEAAHARRGSSLRRDKLAEAQGCARTMERMLRGVERGKKAVNAAYLRGARAI